MGRSNDRYTRSTALTGAPLARGAALLFLAPIGAWAASDPSGQVVVGTADVGHDPSALATLLDLPLGQPDPPPGSAELEHRIFGSTREPVWKGGL